jgi:hypothetical protein
MGAGRRSGEAAIPGANVKHPPPGRQEREEGLIQTRQGHFVQLRALRPMSHGGMQCVVGVPEGRLGRLRKQSGSPGLFHARLRVGAV